MIAALLLWAGIGYELVQRLAWDPYPYTQAEAIRVYWQVAPETIWRGPAAEVRPAVGSTSARTVLVMETPSSCTQEQIRYTVRAIDEGPPTLESGNSNVVAIDWTLVDARTYRDVVFCATALDVCELAGQAAGVCTCNQDCREDCYPDCPDCRPGCPDGCC